MVRVLSLGGGVQSTAIAILIAQGRLPKPDLVVIVDTSRERESTWRYLGEYTEPLFRSMDIPFARIRTRDYLLDRPDEVPIVECGRVLIPAFIQHPGGAKGKMRGYCSGRWKERVFKRYLRSLGMNLVEVWIGISQDESRRRRESGLAWYRHRYPLLALNLSRNDCHGIIREYKWPQPLKSSCWMCPHMRAPEWVEMQRNYPADFEAACRLDEHMRTINPRAYLTVKCRPLRDGVDTFARQECLELSGCGAGFCFS